jgi:phosphate transport system substrate-binding protein
MKLKLVAAASLAAAFMTITAGAQQLNGAGGTFPNPIYQKWFSDYAASHPGVQINYQAVGSGAGIRQASDGLVDFGASDGPMTDQQMSEAKVKLFHIPTVLGGVVPAYTLPGVTADLKFTGDVIADIFLGTITNWNDARIKALNPGVNLPDHQILPVHRSDGSGTTYIFTDYLSKVSPDFKSKVGVNTSVNWPLGIGQKGNAGVAGMVRNTPYSFGYVELIYALQNKMPFGLVKNKDGKFIRASVDSVTAAATGAAKNMPNDFRVSITDAPGAESYPISSFTWLLIPMKSADAKKGEVLRDFMRWMLTTGEAEAPSLDYSPLPKSVAVKVSGAINYLK